MKKHFLNKYHHTKKFKFSNKNNHTKKNFKRYTTFVSNKRRHINECKFE